MSTPGGPGLKPELQQPAATPGAATRRWGRTLVVLALGAGGAGFALGWFARPPVPPSADDRPPRSTLTGEAPPPAGRVPTPATGSEAREVPLPTGAADGGRDGGRGVDAQLDQLIEDANALRRQLREAEAANRDLARRLRLAEATREEAEGVPFPTPAVVPPRHTEASQRALFEAALEELGFDGEVEGVDCSELPCFVHGTLAGADSATLDDDLGRLIEQTRQGMGNDDVYASRSIFEDPDANKADMTWSISWYPPQWHEAGPEAFNKRLRFRKNEYVDTLHP